MLHLVTIVSSFSGGGGTALSSPLLAGLFGLKSHGLLLGVISFSFTIGAALGPFLAGYLFDFAGNYQPAFMVCAAVSMVGIVPSVLLGAFKREAVA